MLVSGSFVSVYSIKLQGQVTESAGGLSIVGLFLVRSDGWVQKQKNFECVQPLPGNTGKSVVYRDRQKGQVPGGRST